jgi:putative nucleotidyltransferase with HDIG domain
MTRRRNVDQTMTERSIVIVNQARDLPPIPTVAQKILDMLQSDKTTAVDVEQVIMAEPALSARVLKIANSAVFGRRAGARTVSEAVTYLGIKTVKSIVLAAAMKTFYMQPRLSDHLLWVHSMAVALSAAELAKLAKIRAKDEALTAGLLHDLGKLVFKNFDEERYDAVIQSVYNDQADAVTVEIETFGVAHPQVAEQVLAKWGFPDDLREPVSMHHVAATDTDQVSPVAHLVCLADGICHYLGIGTRIARGDMSLGDLPSARALKLPGEKLNTFAEEFPERFAERRLMFE